MSGSCCSVNVHRAKASVPIRADQQKQFFNLLFAVVCDGLQLVSSPRSARGGEPLFYSDGNSFACPPVPRISSMGRIRFLRPRASRRHSHVPLPGVPGTILPNELALTYLRSTGDVIRAEHGAETCPSRVRVHCDSGPKAPGSSGVPKGRFLSCPFVSFTSSGHGWCPSLYIDDESFVVFGSGPIW